MENQEKADSYFNKKIDYKMERGNRIDEMIAELIKEYAVTMPIVLISKDRYLVGTKTVFAVIENNTVMFRVGGGYMAFIDYVRKYSDTEIARLKLKIMQTGLSLDRIVIDMIIKVKLKKQKFKS